MLRWSGGPSCPQRSTPCPLENHSWPPGHREIKPRKPPARREQRGSRQQGGKNRVRPFGGLVVGADGGIKILIAFWHDFVKGEGQTCGFHNGYYNGGKAWQGRKGPAWSSLLEGRNGYESCVKTAILSVNTDRLGSLSFSKFSISITAEMKEEQNSKALMK